MMKIKSDSSFYTIPFQSNITIALDNIYLADAIDCLNSYFVKKKKNKCVVYDNEEEIIKNDDLFLININSHSVDDQLQFQEKTVFNEEISEIIRENQLDFMSVDNIIKSIKGLLTDKGVYALKRILSINTDINIEIKMSEFSVEKILSMLSIESDELTSTKKLIIVYNLLIYLNRDKAIVIYINEEIDDVLANWINKTSVSSKNVYFLINSMNYNSEILFDEILLLTNKKELRKTIINKSECEEIIYALSSWTIKNISFQKEKIVNYYKDFYNSDFSVLLKIEE